MKFKSPIKLTDIASWVGAEIVGDKEAVATGINEIHKVQPGDITFSDLEKYFLVALESKASFIILDKEIEDRLGKTVLIHPEPFKAYNDIVNRFRPFEPITTSIDPTAEIHPSVVIEPNVIIGPHVKIAKDAVIMANAYIGSYTEIGERTRVQPSCVIGSDAFYFKKHPTHFERWTSCGRVVIGKDCEIGAACTIDKGVSGDTVIGNGTKFDGQIHIGHGAVVGEHCLFAAQVGIGGKTIIGNNVVLYGQVGVAQNLVIEDNVVVLAKSGVSKNLTSGKQYFGSPAEEVKEKYRQLAALRNLAR